MTRLESPCHSIRAACRILVYVFDAQLFVDLLKPRIPQKEHCWIDLDVLVSCFDAGNVSLQSTSICHLVSSEDGVVSGPWY